MSALDEPKTGDSSAKSLALDYLGDIAAKLRHFHLDSEATVTTSLDEVSGHVTRDDNVVVAYGRSSPVRMSKHATTSPASID